jgi:hypothetical protein
MAISGNALASNMAAGDITGMAQIFGGMFIVMFLILGAIYVYLSLAFMAIGKKAKLQNPGVAWINPIISMFEISGMHWWPWPTMLLGIFMAMGFVIISPIVFGFLYFASIVFMMVMMIIWNWKTFVAVGKPGWWALLPAILGVAGFLAILSAILIPVMVFIGVLLCIAAFILYMVFAGLAAWSK